MLTLLLILSLAQNVLPTVPGHIDPTVTQANINSTICRHGYTKTVRNTPESEKKAVYARDRATKKKGVCCEVDHLVSLELGGTNDLDNLWAQPYEPRPGAHEKDAVENYLNKQICTGAMALDAAQKAIMTNWPKVYAEMQKAK